MPTFPPNSIVPRFLAALVGVLLTCLCVIAGLAIVASIEQSRVSQVHRDATVIVAGMVSDSVSRLRDAVQDLKPDCSIKTLTTLRRWVLASEFISEFGVLDNRGRLICTTTDGELASPITPPTPDVVYNDEQMGEIYNHYFNRPLNVSGAELKSAITSLAQFSAVVNPFKERQLHALGIDLVRVVLPNKTTLIAYSRTGISSEVISQFGTKDFVEGDVAKWNMQSLTYLRSNIVPTGDFVIQSAVLPEQLWQRYRLLLVALVVISIVVGILTFMATLPIIRQRFSFEAQIPKLLRSNNVICLLQPIYDIQNGKLAGCELLMRLWDGSGSVYPDRVIPWVIEHKLTAAFDRAVISRAAIELQPLNFTEDFKVAINFFPDTFLSGLARNLLSQFGNLSSQHVHICLEVTEQQVSGEILDEIDELKKQGYQISVDDFGTGYSNLSSVKSLAPDYLKIDRSFVRDMEDSTVRSSLIPEIIQIARAIGAQVVAEGIENALQLEKLKELGVEYGQGYFLGKPQTIEAFAILLKESSRNGK